MITFKEWLAKKEFREDNMAPMTNPADVTTTLNMMGKILSTNPNVNSIANSLARYPTLAKALATNPNIQRFLAPTTGAKPTTPINPINPAQPTTAPAGQ